MIKYLKVSSDGFTCKCRPGYRLGDDGDCIDKGDPFLLIVKDNQIIDASLMPEDKSRGQFTPVVGLKYGVSVDYDLENKEIYWTEVDAEKQENGLRNYNGTLYRTALGGGEKVDFFGETDSGIVGSPYCVAFDWVGRNMYIGNVQSSEIREEAIQSTRSGSARAGRYWATLRTGFGATLRRYSIENVTWPENWQKISDFGNLYT